jgi:hypothetical protein
MIKIFNNFTGAYFTIPVNSIYLTSKDVKKILRKNITIKDSYYFIMLNDQKIYSNVFDIYDDVDKVYDCTNGLEFFIINTSFTHNDKDYIKIILQCIRDWYVYDRIFKQLYDEQSELLNNINFIIFCSIQTTAIFMYISDDLKNDKKFVIELIKYNHRIINYIPKNLFEELKNMNIIKYTYIENQQPFNKALRRQINNELRSIIRNTVKNIGSDSCYIC